MEKISKIEENLFPPIINCAGTGEVGFIMRGELTPENTLYVLGLDESNDPKERESLLEFQPCRLLNNITREVIYFPYLISYGEDEKNIWGKCLNTKRKYYRE